MKKILIIILLLIGAFLFIRFVLGGPEDDWICQKGEWVKHGQPAAPKPTGNCNYSK